MSAELGNARAKLSEIEGVLAQEGPLPRAQRLWGGADVVITSTQPQPPSGREFYPDPRFVVTRFAGNLSWLFEQLWDGFRPLFDGATKIEFFGRLANAANRYLARTPDTDAKELLAAVLHEAYAIADDLADGSFTYLVVASGNMIYDDLIDEAEREGYMTPEESRRWLNERGL